jgi:hypothetical protein
MSENISIEPMTEDFILWRCLHGGPLSKQTIEQWPEEQDPKWSKFRNINLPILQKLIKTYGTCAIIARKDDYITGMLRFYPKTIASMEQAGYLCMQQNFPAGPSSDLVNQEFPPLDRIEDKTLKIHCIMTSRPYAGDTSAELFGQHILSKNETDARRGIGLKLVRTLIDWAKQQGWEKIEVTTFADLDIFYGITGSAGKSFWEKAGFQLRNTTPMSIDDWPDENAQKIIDTQADAAGITPDQAWSFYNMSCEL